MNVTDADVLIYARDLVREGWTHGRMARDVNGKSVATYSDDAVSWCAVGAVRRAQFELTGRRHRVRRYCRWLRAALPAHNRSIMTFNDYVSATGRKRVILRLFDDAIKLAIAASPPEQPKAVVPEVVAETRQLISV